MLHDHCRAALHAGDRAAFHEALLRFMRSSGFETFTAMLVVDHAQRESNFFCVDNAPEAYQEHYHDVSQGRRDPVMQHCKHRGVPIVWNQGTYVAAGMAEKWECQAAFGYKTGIAAALHLPGSLHFMLSLDRDQALPSNAAERARMAADLLLVMTYAHEAAIRLLAPAAEEPVPALTPRELECLRWTMAGKTAWELSCILGISEHTAVRHTFNASRKLQCGSKHLAVVKALRLGLIA